jgi:hypothetical protein
VIRRTGRPESAKVSDFCAIAAWGAVRTVRNIAPHKAGKRRRQAGCAFARLKSLSARARRVMPDSPVKKELTQYFQLKVEFALRKSRPGAPPVERHARWQACYSG